MSKKKLTQADIYRIRYHLYRKAGYSSSQSQRARSWEDIDVSNIPLDSKGKPVLTDEVKRVIRNIKPYDAVMQGRTVKPRKRKKEYVKVKRKQSTKPSYKDVKKIRYHLYRQAGYNSRDANRLSNRKLDIGKLKLDKDGNVPKNSHEFKRIAQQLKRGNIRNVRVDKEVRNYLIWAYQQENDTIHTDWGMLVKEHPYKERTAKMVKMLEKEHNLNNDQAYYFLYYMYQHRIDYETTKTELLSSREFEMYVQTKYKRNMRGIA